MDATLDSLASAVGINGQSPTVNQRTLARALGQAMLETSAYRQHAVAAYGQVLLEALWPRDETNAHAAMYAAQQVLDTIQDPSVQRDACALLARLGHLHQMSGLLLQEFSLEAAAPSTSARTLPNVRSHHDTNFTSHQTDQALTVAALNAPRLELTFTGHPTNTNSLSSMIAQRELAGALHRWRQGGSVSDVTGALANYARAPLLPERPNAPPGLSVRDEVQTMLYFLNNAYSDLPTVYAGYDHALAKQFADYDPRQLRLGLRYHSWGSSADKDGNGNVNADTTLYAVCAHHQQILRRYHEDLQALPGLESWKQRIAHAQQTTTNILRQIEAQLDTQGFLTETTFDDLKDTLQTTVGTLDKCAFIADLEALPASPESTALLRQVNTFGFSFGTLEYRETSEEFSRIVHSLLPEYPSDEKARCALLEDLLADPVRLSALQQKFKALTTGAEGRPYNKDDVRPIAYQTRKRLELARDFPQAITNHVLAECQNASNLLELLLLLHCVRNRDGRHPTLGFVPLFEDSKPLSDAPKILRTVLSSRAYRAHLDEVAAVQQQPPAQQIQLAHSDNARRNGLPAARALIYRAHQQLRDSMKTFNEHAEKPIALQFYEGGSLSDPFRGGVRALSATINEYGLHAFSKVTVQGGDLLNYFNLPRSTCRVLTRNINNNAVRLQQGTRAEDYDAAAVDALIATGADYKQLFHSPEINSFAQNIGFAEETRSGNTSSRSGTRTTGNAAIDVTKTRTISFSEALQHAGLTPTWIGSLNLHEHLQNAGIASNSPRTLNHFYKTSPLFKDAIDRMLFGLIRTDLSYLRERCADHPLMARFEKEYERALTLGIEAYTGKPFSELTGDRSLSLQEQRDLLVHEVYPHVANVFVDQDRFTMLAREMKRHWLSGQDDPYHRSMLLHNAMDTVLHGRLPLIDDPGYAKLYCQEHGIARPHVPSHGSHLAA